MHPISPLSILLLFLLLTNGNFYCAIVFASAFHYYDKLYMTKEICMLYSLAILYSISLCACFSLCFVGGTLLLWYECCNNYSLRLLIYKLYSVGLNTVLNMLFNIHVFLCAIKKLLMHDSWPLMKIKIYRWYGIGKAFAKHVPVMFGYRHKHKHVEFNLQEENDIIDSILEN